MEDDELKHYGVKGMKWGIRRTPAQLGHTKKKSGDSDGDSEETPKKQKVAKTKSKPKKISEMTDEELNQKIARLELEKKYVELQSSLYPSKGQSWINKALKQAGESSLRNLGEQAFDTLGGEGINRLAAALTGNENPNDPATRIVNPRKRQSAKK